MMARLAFGSEPDRERPGESGRESDQRYCDQNYNRDGFEKHQHKPKERTRTRCLLDLTTPRHRQSRGDWSRLRNRYS